MKRIISRAYRICRKMKRHLADPDYREKAVECAEDAAGFVSMFVILFMLTVMF